MLLRFLMAVPERVHCHVASLFVGLNLELALAEADGTGQSGITLAVQKKNNLFAALEPRQPGKPVALLKLHDPTLALHRAVDLEGEWLDGA